MPSRILRSWTVTRPASLTGRQEALYRAEGAEVELNFWTDKPCFVTEAKLN